jgi:hypothetical protein
MRGFLETATILAVFMAGVCSPEVRAQPLTIHEIQSNTSDGDASVYVGQVVDCAGGVVVGKFRGTRYRIILQDPTSPDGWGGIQVKDWTNNDLYNNVEIGDWVALTDVLVEEFVGNTMLQWQTPYNPGFTIVSQGNPAPEPVLLTAADVAYPPNHSVTERYEHMRVRLQDVTVGQKDLGKADDNYELIQGSDIAWAADYMNMDAGAPYDPRIETGVRLSSITGMLEQYTYAPENWDYYQVCTQSAADIVVAEAEAVPSVSEWGIVVMTLCLLAAGTILVRLRARKCGGVGNPVL